MTLARHDYDPGCDCQSCREDRKHSPYIPTRDRCAECGEAWPCDVAVNVQARTERDEYTHPLTGKPSTRRRPIAEGR